MKCVAEWSMFCKLTYAASSYIRASKEPLLLYDQKSVLKLKYSIQLQHDLCAVFIMS
jgi:hypothetical protein